MGRYVGLGSFVCTFEGARVAHFARVENKVVQTVKVVNNAALAYVAPAEVPQVVRSILGPGEWVQCSYNGQFRNAYPGRGWRYDAELDIFMPPQQEVTQ